MTLQPTQSLKNFVLDTVPESRSFSHSQDPPLPDFVHRLLHEVRNTWQLEQRYEGAGVTDYLPLLLGAGNGVRRLLS